MFFVCEIQSSISAHEPADTSQSWLEEKNCILLKSMTMDQIKTTSYITLSGTTMGHGDQPQCKRPIQCDTAVTKGSDGCSAPHSTGCDGVIFIHRKAGCKSGCFTCFPV